MLIEWNHLQVIIYLDFYGYFTQSGGVKGQAILKGMADNPGLPFFEQFLNIFKKSL